MIIISLPVNNIHKKLYKSLSVDIYLCTDLADDSKDEMKICFYGTGVCSNVSEL